MLPLLLLVLVAPAWAVTNGDPHCAVGRDTIVHLFEWKWSDIAQECERFLGPRGFCGVQVSPPSENRVVTNPNRPWWERYQPVSYKLVTRSGDENAFRDMVNRCFNVGVRIYVDAVINHMTGAGGSGFGTAGSPFNAESLSFSAVPFSHFDFNDGSNCHTSDLNIHDYLDVNQVRNCRLLSLLDLKTGSDYVRTKTADYLNHLIDLGVAGFRVDAAKHMWPGDLSGVFSKVKNLRADLFGSGKRPFVVQEVIDLGGEPIKATEYIGTGRVTNFVFGGKLGEVFRRKNAMKWLSNWGEGWGMMKTDEVLVFVDNHDNQRGHGGGGDIITHFESRLYKLATAFMLAHPYGFPRVMSSYSFNRNNGDQGPPQNGDGSIRDVTINADGTCGNGWVCEHRWRQIYSMVEFRNVANHAPLQNWWSGADYQIAFSRGSMAFIAFNLEGFDLNTNLMTGLPSGTYCDVISGSKVNGQCTGRTVQVQPGGRADIHVGHTWEDSMIAIHVNSRL